MSLATVSATPSLSHSFHSHILRAYDIRGIVGETLDVNDARAIGRAVATMVVRDSGKEVADVTIATGRDGRLSSPELEQALADGLASTGVNVVRVGCGPSPMLYYAVRTRNLDGGVMVTGSHNPPSHNGFKMMKSKLALTSEEILELGKMSAAGDVLQGEGQMRNIEVHEEYTADLVKGLQLDKVKQDLKVVWDAGNGAAGDIMQALVKKLPGEHVLLNEVVDGNFPAHHPDPSEEKNMLQLMAEVKAQGADIGVAFDGDGDRVGAVDAKGQMLFGDQLMILFARDVLSEKPGATVIADVKASQSLFDEVKKMGGNPVIWKTGNTFIKAKMAETGAELAGEMSGHIFFADRYYGFDDGLYGAVRLINIVAKENRPLADIVDDLPKACNTPEIRIDVSEERKFAIIDEVKTRLKEGNIKFSDIDGVRVMYDDGWWLLRASNTQAALVGRCEAEDDKSLENMKNDLIKQLSQSGVDIS